MNYDRTHHDIQAQADRVVQAHQDEVLRQAQQYDLLLLLIVFVFCGGLALIFTGLILFFIAAISPPV